MGSLRAFEAAARHLSFTQAATELNMTQGAVSQQIKNLEELVGLKLFVRERNTIRLTEGGQEYLGSARAAITEILVATDRAIDRHRGDILTIACLGSYSAKCLMPKMNDFVQANPQIRVRLRTLIPSVPAVASDYDISIQYGQGGDWPGHDAVKLGEEESFPVCSPALLTMGDGLRSVGDLARQTVIRIASPLTLRDDWPVWLEHVGESKLKFAAEVTCDSLYPLYQGAIGGLGVAMGRSAIVADDLASGRLVEPFSFRLSSPLGYFLVAPLERAHLPKVKCFRDWALRSFRTDVSGSKTGRAKTQKVVSGVRSGQKRTSS